MHISRTGTLRMHWDAEIKAAAGPSTLSFCQPAASKMHTASVTLVALSLLCAVTMTWSMALTPEQKERFSNTLDLGEDDGSVETALMNYLFAKQIVSRLRNQLDVTDLQRKRSYWKQCAFNAVSCFG